MFFCPDCHVSNRSDAKFCRRCGRSRSDLERAEVSVAVADVPDPTVAGTVEPVADQPVEPVVNQRVELVADQPFEPSVDLPAPEEVDVESQIIEDAPTLALNIEQEVSLSAPPDLNSPECPSCWKALRATDKFCCWCGEAQPNRVLPFLKLCLECSTFLPEKANYCYSCGTDVGYSSRRKVRVPHELFKDEESEFFPRFDA